MDSLTRAFLCKSFLGAMGDDHIAPFDAIALDAADKCINSVAMPRMLRMQDDYKERILEMCLSVDISDITEGRLVIEEWAVYSGDIRHPVPMVRNTAMPRPVRRRHLSSVKNP